MSTVTKNQGVERATDTLDILGESALWCGASNTLHWVDIRAPALRRLDPQTGQVTSWILNDLCGGVVLSILSGTGHQSAGETATCLGLARATRILTVPPNAVTHNRVLIKTRQNLGIQAVFTRSVMRASGLSSVPQSAKTPQSAEFPGKLGVTALSATPLSYIKDLARLETSINSSKLE